MEGPDTDDIKLEEDAKQAPVQQAPAEQASAQEAPTRQAPRQQVGELLRAARLEQGMSTQDVARQLRLSVRQIEALEENEYGKLAGGTFLRGFVRNYAKLLQLDEAPLLRLLEQSVPPPPAQILPPQIEGIPLLSNRDRIKRYLIGSGAVLVLLLLIYEIYRGNEATVEKQPSVAPEAKVEPELRSEPLPLPLQPRASEQSPTPPNESSDATPAEKGVIEHEISLPGAATAQVPSSPPPGESQVGVAPETADPASDALPNAGAANTDPVPTPPSYSGTGIHLLFNGESRAEVKDGRGNLLLSKLNLAGSEQVLHGQPPYSLTIGNAAQVKLVYNNRPVDLLPYIDPNVGTAHLSLE